MKVVETNISDVKILEPKVFEDDRGYFFESWSANSFSKNGMPSQFVQDNQSCSRKNVLRGLHYQIGRAQGKLVRAVTGALFDVAVDIRRNSSTFGQWVGVELSEHNRRMLWIPVGFAHGFLSLKDSTVLAYKCTDFYSSEHERTIIWNDASLGIAWPLVSEEAPLISPKDMVGATLDRAEVFS